VDLDSHLLSKVTGSDLIDVRKYRMILKEDFTKDG
jgi:hypothetical protein